MEKQVRVGVGVLIYNNSNDKILFGKRKGAHGSNFYAPPGGHLEFGEKIFQCAKREVLEEVGVELKNLIELGFTNDKFDKEDKHYITILVKAQISSGEIKNMEPHKCEAWDWYSLDKLPKELFIPIKNAKLKGLF